MWIARLIYLNGCWTSILAGLQTIPLLIAITLGEERAAAAFAASIGLFLMLGGGLFLGFRGIRTRQTTFMLILIPVTAMLTAGMTVGAPFYFWDEDIGFMQALYEGVSLVTTSGASVLEDLEQTPTSLMAWRALSAWLSGFAAMVTVLVIFTQLNLGAARMHPHVSITATNPDSIAQIKRAMLALFPLYLLVTFSIAILLSVTGTPLAQGLYLAMGTVSLTGLPVTSSISPIMTLPINQLILSAGMILAMSNWDALHASMRRSHGEGKRDRELRPMLFFGAAGLLVASFILIDVGLPERLMTVISALSSTGWSTLDASFLSPGLTFLLLILMSLGGSMISASGGIRQLRFGIIIGLARRELGRLAHPSGIHPIKVGSNTVQETDVDALWLLLALTTVTLLAGTIMLGAQGTRFDSAFLLTVGHITLAAPMVTTLDPDFFGFAGLYDGELFALILVLLIGRVEATVLLLILGSRYLR